MNLTIYYPSVDSTGQAIDNRDEFMQDHVRQICTISGGCTVDNQVAGYYVTQAGQLLSESVNRVNIYLSGNGMQKKLEDIVALCYNIKTQLRQESLLVTRNGKAKFL